MEQSAFIKWVEKYFPGVTVGITKKLNDTNSPRPYFFKSLLKPAYSVDGKWETILSENVYVVADYVAMDSDDPLKTRDSMGKANGDIPKMALKFWLSEKQLTALDTLIAQGGTESQIVAELFKDVNKAIGGAYERNEASFLEGFSTGITEIPDGENVGTAIRLDFKYPTKNKFGVDKVLTDVTAKFWDRVQAIKTQAQADGNIIEVAYTDPVTLGLIMGLDQTKQLFAFSQNFVGSNIPTPDLEQLNTFAKRRYGIVFVEVDRTCVREKNKTRTPFKPWDEGKVIFTAAGPVGQLVWARLAEQNRPVAGVSYQTVDEYMLISKYRKNEPQVSEWTKMQARVVPVISNVHGIYQLDTKVVQG